MPRNTKKVTPAEPGIVRLRGLIKTFNSQGPSGEVYRFKNGVETVVRFEDWAWLHEVSNSGMRRFEFIRVPDEPEPPEEPVDVPDGAWITKE